jgi:hypothetical protein
MPSGIRAAWVSTDHLEAEAREAWFQIARDPLDRFGGDLLAICLQSRNSRP